MLQALYTLGIETRVSHGLQFGNVGYSAAIMDITGTAQGAFGKNYRQNYSATAVFKRRHCLAR